MAVFLLVAKYGSGFIPDPALGTVFADVSSTSFAAAWIERLYAEGITGGCASNPARYCPNNSVNRAQMAVFLLVAHDGSSIVPGSGTDVFDDVPSTSPFAWWIEELHRRGVTAGCGGGPGGLLYCPSSAVTRGQMAVFLATMWQLPMN